MEPAVSEKASKKYKITIDWGAELYVDDGAKTDDLACAIQEALTGMTEDALGIGGPVHHTETVTVEKFLGEPVVRLQPGLEEMPDFHVVQHGVTGLAFRDSVAIDAMIKRLEHMKEKDLRVVELIRPEGMRDEDVIRSLLRVRTEGEYLGTIAPRTQPWAAHPSPFEIGDVKIETSKVGGDEA